MKIIITLLIFCASVSGADSLKWVGYADTHYGSENIGQPWTWDGGDSISNEVVYAEANYNPDFFLIPGDVGEVVNTATVCTTHYYQRFLDDMAYATVPYYVNPGNHDIPNGNQACWLQFFPLNQSWTNGNYVFISVRTWQNSSDFKIDTADLDYLEGIITNAMPTYTNFIVSAHPSIHDNNPFGSITDGLERMTNIFDTYKVVAYIHGHMHSVEPAAQGTAIPNTSTKSFLVPSLTRYVSGYGTYQVFDITGTTLTSTRYRTDTRGVVATGTWSVPEYIANWPISTVGGARASGSVIATGGAIVR